MSANLTKLKIFGSFILFSGVASFFVVGCKKENLQEKRSVKVDKKPLAKVAQKSVKKKKVAPASPPPILKISKEKRAKYFRHLKRGRKFAKQKEWAKATAHFEKALKILPMDSRALSELGWAAFNSGDYKKAQKANRDSVNGATLNNLKAASLYNLGRTEEALSDTKAARRYYVQSLKLRDNKTVKKRLEGLGGKTISKGSVAVNLDDVWCTGLKKSVKEICACVKKEFIDQDGGDPENYQTECEEKEEFSDDKTRLVRFSGNLLTDYYYLVAKQPKGWEIVAQVGYVYNPGAFGIMEEMEFKKLEEKEIGKRTVLWIESDHNRSDRDAGIAEEEGREVKTLTICVLPRKKDGLTSCPLQVVVLDDYERFRDEDMAEMYGVTKEDMKAHGTKGLPIKEKTELKVTVKPDGVATITLVSGKRTKKVVGFLGTHKLW